MWRIHIAGVLVFESLYYDEASCWYKFFMDEGIKHNNISLTFKL